MTEETPKALPAGWVCSNLRQLITLNYGKSLPAHSRDGVGFCVYGSNGVVGKHSVPLVMEPSLIVGRKGSIGQIHYSEAPCSPIDTTYYIDEFYGQSPKFWLYWLDGLDLPSMNRASAIPGLNREDVYELLCLLPPLNEQRRIVSKIEALQTHSTAAKEALDAIPPLLEKFRQSVLASAFRGDLTKKWREQNPDVEPASVLLERIRAERKRKWIEGYAEKYRAKDEAKAKKAGKPWGEEHDRKALEKHRKKGEEKYVAPEPVDTEGLPELPEGWCWASLEELTALSPNAMTDGPFGSKLKTKHYVDSGVRVVRLGNLGVGIFKDSDRAFITEEHFESLRKHEIRGGDLVIAALAEPVGRCCQIPAGIGKAIVKADCVKFTPHRYLERTYVMHWLNSSTGRGIAELNSHGIGRLRINMANMRGLPVPVAPQAEQVKIVSVCAEAASCVVNWENDYATWISQVNTLQQAVLAKAFRGELVPQDPNDEPASVLLEKIKAERATTQSHKKKAAPATTPSTSAQTTPDTEKPSPPPASMDGWKQPTLFEGAASELSTTAQKILACLQGAMTPMSKADVLSQVEASATEWNVGIAELVQVGKAVREGRGRGTKYRATIAG